MGCSGCGKKRKDFKVKLAQAQKEQLSLSTNISEIKVEKTTTRKQRIEARKKRIAARNVRIAMRNKRED